MLSRRTFFAVLTGAAATVFLIKPRCECGHPDHVGLCEHCIAKTPWFACYTTPRFKYLGHKTFVMKKNLKVGINA